MMTHAFRWQRPARRTSSWRGNEIGSIILYNNVWRSVGKLFNLWKIEWRLVSSSRGCLCAYRKALSRWCFSALVDKSVESCPIFSTTVRRSDLQSGGCLGMPRYIAHLPRDPRNEYIVRNRADTTWEWRLREAGTEEEYLNEARGIWNDDL